ISTIRNGLMKSESANPLETNELQSREKLSTDIGDVNAAAYSGGQCDGYRSQDVEWCSPPPPQEPNLSSAHLTDLTSRARGYVEAASAANTRKAYAADWKHFSAWCRRSGLCPLPPHPQNVGLYITACASGSAVGPPTRGTKANAVSTIERRLASLSWNYAQRGLALDRKDRHIATVMSGIRKSHAKLSVQKEAVLAEHIIAMIGTLDRGTLRACVIAPCCSSAMRAVCAAPRSSDWT
ncbi:hypothetical protein C8J38_1141, partial [Rhizobium sp. PP-WC-2G-219]